MKVFVACEYSGRVRDAFIERGHEADRAKIRSLTYQGIATAMADQWG